MVNAALAPVLSAPVGAGPAGGATPLSLDTHRIWPPVVLAPMAGVTDTPYRVVCSRRGAPLCVNEMVTARAIVERHAPTLAMLDHHPSEPLRSLQLYGTDPYYLGEAVRFLVDSRPLDHLDLNFGCPAPKVTRLGGVAALPFKRPLFARMIRSAVAAAGDIPVTVKFRMGIDDDHLTYLDAGHIAQDEGSAWVALHARTAEQLYAPSARWDAIGELVSALDVPVLGNGDIFEANDALAMMAATGCDGVVIGRGCLGRPWLFAELSAAFTGAPAPTPPTLRQIADIVRRHGTLLAEHFGEDKGMRDIRKHVAWYLHGLPAGGDLRRALALVTTCAQLDDLLGELAADVAFPSSANGPRGRQGSAAAVALPQGWLTDPDDCSVPAGAEVMHSGG